MIRESLGHRSNAGETGYDLKSSNSSHSFQGFKKSIESDVSFFFFSVRRGSDMVDVTGFGISRKKKSNSFLVDNDARIGKEIRVWVCDTVVR